MASSSLRVDVVDSHALCRLLPDDPNGETGCRGVFKSLKVVCSIIITGIL